ncbi:MAG: hypothetical protein D4R97_02480 [Bacteroidetes bacterium]|nr:MAG: hypothetical protein D4R97_02480 [Bacteroidota bacterium]
MANITSQHILSTSATLLGFTLFVITSMEITNYAELSIVDEFTSVVSLSLIFSCLFSFFSIRSTNKIRENQLETIADYLFAGSLLGILIIISLIALHIIK